MAGLGMDGWNGYDGLDGPVFCLLDAILSVFVCVVGFTPKDFLYTYMQGVFEGFFLF